MVLFYNMDLWKNYRNILFNVFPDLTRDFVWANWEGKRKINLRAEVHKGPHFIKAKSVDIWNEKTNIYNMILYPRTGSNLPCFGMDLLGFFERKVLITFDFHHPVEYYRFSIEDRLPKTGTVIRFFEPGNHFSDHVFVKKCTMAEVNKYLKDFTAYLKVYKEMVESVSPQGNDETVYRDFDSYMKRLDPVKGYLVNQFGKERTDHLVNQFLFPSE